MSIDEELASALERSGSLSAKLDDAGWALVEREQQAQRLAALLDQLDEQYGPLPDDPEEDARIDRLLGGVA